MLKQEFTRQRWRRTKEELRLNRVDLLDKALGAVFDGEMREEDEN
jgi:hypothetical protein